MRQTRKMIVAAAAAVGAVAGGAVAIANMPVAATASGSPQVAVELLLAERAQHLHGARSARVPAQVPPLLQLAELVGDARERGQPHDVADLAHGRRVPPVRNRALHGAEDLGLTVGECSSARAGCLLSRGSGAHERGPFAAPHTALPKVRAAERRPLMRVGDVGSTVTGVAPA